MGSLSGKVVVVTGATAGVGKEILKGLVKDDARVVVVARNVAKAEAVVAEVGGDVSVVKADVSVVGDLVRAGAEIVRRWPKVDVLIHNAATIPLQRTTTAEGPELSFAANTVGPLVLTRALLPSLSAAAPSRVIFLIGATAPIDLDDVQFTQRYQGWQAYQRTKFGSLLVLRHLADALPTGVTIHGAFPGVVDTPGMDDAIKAQPLGGRVMLTLMRPFMRTPARGAYSTLWAATAPELSSSTGKLWTWKKPIGGGVAKGWDDAASADKLVAQIDGLTKPLLSSSTSS